MNYNMSVTSSQQQLTRREQSEGSPPECSTYPSNNYIIILNLTIANYHIHVPSTYTTLYACMAVIVRGLTLQPSSARWVWPVSCVCQLTRESSAATLHAQSLN